MIALSIAVVLVVGLALCPARHPNLRASYGYRPTMGSETPPPAPDTDGSGAQEARP